MTQLQRLSAVQRRTSAPEPGSVPSRPGEEGRERERQTQSRPRWRKREASIISSLRVADKHPSQPQTLTDTITLTPSPCPTSTTTTTTISPLIQFHPHFPLPCSDLTDPHHRPLDLPWAPLAEGAIALLARCGESIRCVGDSGSVVLLRLHSSIGEAGGSSVLRFFFTLCTQHC